MKGSLQLRLIAALTCIGLTASGLIPARAGTTGEIQGFVTDADFHSVTGVQVSAFAPSSHATAITAATGFYSLNGLPLDTYTLTFSKDGYRTQSIPDITTIQDQSIRVNTRLETDIKTLARVTVRSSTSLVQPTVTADTYVVNKTKHEEINGTPQDPTGFQFFHYLPGVMTDNAGFPIIRAGAENDVGYTYDDIENTETITRGSINGPSLNGTQSVQLSTGGYDVSAGNTNSGVINQVITRGAYPAKGQATIRVMSPIFGHELSFDYGGASPNNRFSYYYSFAGQNDAIAYGDRVTILPLTLGNQQFGSGYDEVLNLFYHFGKGDKNEVQFLSNLSGAIFDAGLLVDPSIAPYASNNGNVQAGSDPFGLGPQRHPSTLQSDYITLYPGQVVYRQNTGALDTYTYDSIIDKLNFKRQLGPSTFAEARLFRTTENFVNRFPYNVGSFSDSYVDVQATGLGEAFDYTDQLNSQHELSVGGDGVYYKNEAFGAAAPSLEPTFEPLEDLGCPQIAAAITGGKLTPTGSFNSTPGIGGCYIGPFNNALNLAVPGLGLPTDAAHAPLSTFVSDFVNIYDPAYRYDMWVKDQYQPTQRLTITFGLRWDKESLSLPLDAAFQNTTYYINDSGNVVTVPGQPIGSDVTQPWQISPRVAASYQVDPRDVIRFSYGKNIEFASLYAIERAFHVPGYLQNCNIANGCFRALPGYGNTNFVTNLYQQVVLDLTTHENAQYAPVLPQRAVNLDFSYSHDFGNGFEARVTPYYRRGSDYAISNQPLLFVLPTSGTPVFGPSNQQSAGKNESTGVELALQRNARYGFSGLLDATYDNTLANYDGDIFPNVNNAALAASHFFHVTYVPPLVGTLNLVYNARAPWYVSTTVSYESGYRYGVGTETFVFINGVPTQVLNTDLASTPSQAYYFTDPTNPGTISHPNIVASRGTPEGADPGTLFTPAVALVNVTLSYYIGTGANNAEVGVRVQNLFGNYTPTGIPANLYYVPQGIGGYGPGSGINTNACAPGQTFGCEPFMYNQSVHPYENEPSGPLRVYTFFISAKY